MKRRKRGGNRDGADGGARVEGPSFGSGPVRHIPVLLHEMLAALNPKNGERYIDATFGAGGYTLAILAAADCEVLALDRDPSAIEAGVSIEMGRGVIPAKAGIHNDSESDAISGMDARLRGNGNDDRANGCQEGQNYRSPLTLIQTPFSELEAAAHSIGWDHVDGIVFDLGVSSMQLDEAERGFSFMRDGPLDMRMGRDGQSAADVVNTFAQEEIADILYKYGEERRSRAIAAAIVKDRVETTFTTTLQLADMIGRVLGRRHDDPKHPATRSFQALRLFVNDELSELERALSASERILKPGGRLVVVSFHSLEDRIVKHFLSERSGKSAGTSRYAPPVVNRKPQTFELIHRNGIVPTPTEIAHNPRARSARLRAALRI